MRQNPPFSPVLLAGLAMPGFVRPIVGRVAQSFACGVWSRHRTNFDRMADFEGTRFVVDPIDLPLAFVLVLDEEGPQLTLLDTKDGDAPENIAATIRGSLRALLDLAEGRVDGDTLFFNRDLSIEGDTEAVVALRNAIDDADLDLIEEFSKLLGPLSKPAQALAVRSASVFNRLVEDTQLVQNAILGPLTKRTSAQASELADIEDRLGTVERNLKRSDARAKAQDRKLAAKSKESEKLNG